MLEILCAIAMAMAASAPARPPLIASAAPDDVVYYFGVGSNMLKSKLLNRGLNGSKIDLLEMRPALVRGHRLAFNMRGFPPLEPGMGALEPDAEAAGECHGALCKMTAANYEKVWLSEGGAMPSPGYEEVVVEAEGYGLPGPVKALSLRAREQVRLKVDADPSERYMRLLIDGAKELGLTKDYVAALEQRRTQRVGGLLRLLAIHHLFIQGLFFRFPRLRPLAKGISSVLWCAYVPSSHPSLARRLLGDALLSLLLLPTALLGSLVRLSMKIRGTPLPPMMQTIIKPAPPAAAAATAGGAAAAIAV
jgi:hypothetical protein